MVTAIEVVQVVTCYFILDTQLWIVWFDYIFISAYILFNLIILSINIGVRDLTKAFHKPKSEICDLANGEWVPYFLV